MTQCFTGNTEFIKIPALFHVNVKENTNIDQKQMNLNTNRIYTNTNVVLTPNSYRLEYT